MHLRTFATFGAGVALAGTAFFYRFREPRYVEEGAVLRATGWWDNSPGNPFNPDPSAEVGFGEQTYDEMLIGYFDWVRGTGAPGDAGGTAGRIADGQDGT